MLNEAAMLNRFRNRVLEVLGVVPGLEVEFICVDDGSTDQTLNRLLEIQQLDPRFRIIELSRNFGKEAALSAGLDHAQGDIIIPIDVDLQDPPELIPTMIDRWHSGFDVVLAKRTDRSSDSSAKRVSAKLFYRLHNMVSKISLPEDVGDYRLMDRQVVDALRQLPESERFMKGLFAWVGFRCCTVQYTREARAAGHTKFSGWKLWNLALEGVTGFGTMPLRLWTYVGLLGAAGSASYALFIITRRLIYGADVPGYASLLVIILFMGSIQLMSIGILGEYLGRTYMESKRRPRYIVRKVYGH